MDKKDKKIAKNLVGIVLILLLTATPHLAAAFSDINADNPQYKAVEALKQLGTITGYADGTFQPNKLINKAEFLAILFRHLGYKPAPGSYRSLFEDVPPESWFAPYVDKALKLNLISINPAFPRFHGEGPLTRIEAFRLVALLSGIPAPFTTEETTVFEDIAPNFPQWHLIKAAEKSQVFIAKEYPYFLPDQVLTRGDAAELIYKAHIYGATIGNIQLLELINELDSAETSPANAAGLTNNPKYPLFVNVWSKINDQYIDIHNVNRNDLLYGAIQGMVQSLNDPHSVFEPPATAEALENYIEGSYEGIGTVIGTYENEFVITSVIPGSPAESSGLKVGDTIIRIDGLTINHLTIDELLEKIKGAAGTSFQMTIRRDEKLHTYQLTRQKIDLDTVQIESGNTTPIPDSIAYIAIYQFTQSTGSDFRDAITVALQKKPKGLILDLRDNPGGYVSSAYEVLELFLRANQVMVKMERHGLVNDARAEKNNDLLEGDLPVIVLINNNSASASEIVAGALQDYEKATLLGEQSYGKGTVQELNIYEDNSLFKLTTARWYTPKTRNIDEIGLTPDIQVSLTREDLLNNTDTQLLRAIQELQQ